MFPFYYQNEAAIYKAFENKTELIVNFKQWGATKLPDNFMHHFLGGVACRSDGCIYLRDTKRIYLFDPNQSKLSVIYSLPKNSEKDWTKKLNHDCYIKGIKVRSYGVTDVLFFLVVQPASYFNFEEGEEYKQWIYSFSEDNKPILYAELSVCDFLVPDVWCQTGEVRHISPYFSFSFGKEDENLYVTIGLEPPCGYYVFKQAGLDHLSGKPERFHVDLSFPCSDMNCWDEVTLYYKSSIPSGEGHAPCLRRIDRLPLPLMDEIVESFAERPNCDGEVSMRDFDSSWKLKSEIRWVQRSLNVVSSLSPPLKVDGVFGSATQRALREFQMYALPSKEPDGIHGPRTRRKLIQFLKAHYGSQPW